MSALADKIAALIQEARLPPAAAKSVLREAVGKAWPGLPPWTTLENGPVIEEVQKAAVGSGAILTFREDGVRKVVLAQAGEHYRRPGEALPALYMIAGGFINLTRTPGSSLVPAADAAEHPATGAAREMEEELRTPGGAPLLPIDPDRLALVDALTLDLPGGEKRLVIGQALELTPDEAALVKAHIARMARDETYRTAVVAQSVNHDSGLPEIGGLSVVTLDDAARGAVPLLHRDQISLFRKAAAHFAADDDARTGSNPVTAPVRAGPTRAYGQKVRTLDALRTMVADARAAEPLTVGITSGAFDLIHPGHISFLDDARRHCDFLVAVIASDRTVRDQKGLEKPYIPADKRAATIAAIATVDAVIISDEPYHETILRALRPDILFKGDDYAGMRIMGAELVDRVILIPCADKEFNSSSAFIRKIQEGGAPAPAMPPPPPPAPPPPGLS